MQVQVSLSVADGIEARPSDLVALDEALNALAEIGAQPGTNHRGALPANCRARCARRKHSCTARWKRNYSFDMSAGVYHESGKQKSPNCVVHF